MRILFLSQVLPYPLDAGPKMRSYYVLRQLSQHHEVTLLTFVRDTDRPEFVAHLAEFCPHVRTVPMKRSRLKDLNYALKSVVNGNPFLILRDHVPDMVDEIKTLVQQTNFDVIHADQLWMAQYAQAAKKFSPRSKLILDQHNAVYLIPQRMASDESNRLKRLFLAGESKRLAAYEVQMWREFDHVVWVTAEDQQAVLDLASAAANGRAPSTVIPICAAPSQTEPIAPVSTPHRVTFLGGLHWPPNAQGVLWFADEVFPRVKAAAPEAVLTAIGKNPPAGLDREGVEVTGYVDDPKPYLAETAVFIVPLHAGGGMRVKIIDAWSWALPMVSTTIGAEG
ncbi:MAG: glycosyltransferase family 4 protein, partial [Anaerolineae bacterium]|nr:glycosyltransferase family 4 protein [Anaerolineae bacterium]